jgi:HSP20 family molecular chaperone IbpA
VIYTIVQNFTDFFDDWHTTCLYVSKKIKTPKEGNNEYGSTISQRTEPDEPGGQHLRQHARGHGDDRCEAPAVDVQEHEDAYVLTAELPGIDENDVEVTLEDGRLKIETRKEESGEESDKEGEGRYLLRERRKAVFSRSFRPATGRG